MAFMLSQTAEYALRAMVCIAGRESATPVRAVDIGNNANVPPAYLSKILSRLVHAGLLKSTKGHHGGFWLARPTDSIHLYEIFEAVEVELDPNRCAFGMGKCNHLSPCPVHPLYLELREALQHWAKTHTLAEVGPSQNCPRISA